MTPEEREQMFALCAQIAIEKDPQVFTQLVQQLNDLLEGIERRLEEKSDKT